MNEKGKSLKSVDMAIAFTGMRIKWKRELHRAPSPASLCTHTHTLSTTAKKEIKRHSFPPITPNSEEKKHTLRTRLYKSAWGLAVKSALMAATPSWYLRMAFNSFWTSEDLRMSWSTSASEGLITSGSLSLFRKPALAGREGERVASTPRALAKPVGGRKGGEE